MPLCALLLRRMWSRPELQVPAVRAEKLIRNLWGVLASPRVSPHNMILPTTHPMPVRDIGIACLEVAPEWNTGVVVDAGEAADTGAVVGGVDVGIDTPVVDGAWA